MKAKSHGQRPEDRQSTISALNAAIGALDLAENTTPAKAIFSFVGALLATIRVSLLLSSNDLLQIHAYTGLDG